MKITVKEKLVSYMLNNGNSFTYTEMIKALLKIKRGKDYTYDWKSDRGYFATNFNSYNGYMVTGCGNCGVYKDKDGKWKGKYYSKEEKAEYKARGIVNDLTNYTRFVTSNYMKKYEEAREDLEYGSYEENKRAYEIFRMLNHDFRTTIENAKNQAIKKIVKINF